MDMYTERNLLNAALRALSDPTRRDILARCKNQMRTVGSLANEYAISQPAVSKHVRVLEKAGLVQKLRLHKHVYVFSSPTNYQTIQSTVCTLLS